MEQTIIRLAIGLVLLVAVNVVLGSLNALFDGTFDRIKCRNGVIKGIIIAACFVAFYVAGRLNPDIVAIDIDGETVNVATAANLAMVTAYVLYAKDVFSKLSKLVLSKTSGTPEQTGGYLFNIFCTQAYDKGYASGSIFRHCEASFKPPAGHHR